MKLWQKTSLICISVLVMIVSACSTILLIRSKNAILDLTYQQVQIKQQNLAASFLEMANYYITDTDSDTLKSSLVHYCFTRFADASSVLVRGNETLFSGISIAPEEFLLLDKEFFEQEFYEGMLEGRNILIVGSPVQIHGSEYGVYVVEDISTVYNSIVDMLWLFVMVSVTGILIGAVLIAFLMHRSTKPLMALAGVSRRIAHGEYAIRSDVNTNDEIGMLSGDFNRMADAVEAHIDELTETAERQRLFIGGVTHEFKTPLTSLLLHARMLRRANMTDEEKDNSLEHIETQCEWLERMVQALLKLISLEQRIEIQDTSVAELLERVRQSTQQTLTHRGAVLEIHCKTDSLPMNSDLMHSLLVNLVDNASKAYDAGSKGRKVYLSASDHVIEVKDNGRGIPQDALKRVLEPFYMVDQSRSKKNSGSGLGLALVKKIADAHAAKLMIESIPGEGTAIRVVFEIT